MTSKSTSASQQKERGKNTENMCEMKILFGLGLLEDGCNETFSKILHVGVAELFAEKMHFFPSSLQIDIFDFVQIEKPSSACLSFPIYNHYISL